MRLTDEAYMALKGRVTGGDRAAEQTARASLVRERGHGVQFTSPGLSGCSTQNPSPPFQSFFIPGALPGLNEIVGAAHVRRGKWSKYGDMKAAHQEYIVTLIRKAKLRPMELVTIEFTWHEASKRRDKDNIAAGKKFICDALKEAGVLANDGWKNIDGFSDQFIIDRTQPGVTVTLKERT